MSVARFASRVGNPKLAAVVGKWQFVDEALREPPGEIGSVEFEHLLTHGSFRLGIAPLRTNSFVPPGTKLYAHLQPKVFKPRVTIDKDRSIFLFNSMRDELKEDTQPNTYDSWQPLRAVSSDFLVLDKPPGLPSIEPADATESALVPHWLRRYLPRQLGLGPLAVTARLDAGTHGLLVVGRSSSFSGEYNKLLQARAIKKKYVAVVRGWNPDENPRHIEGIWTHYYPKRSHAAEEWDPHKGLGLGQQRLTEVPKLQLDRMRYLAQRERSTDYPSVVQLIVQKAKPAHAASKALRNFQRAIIQNMLARAESDGEPLFELEIDLLTGRTHQIRAQLYAEGVSIIGDWLYSAHEAPEPDSFALCCSGLAWTCPNTKKQYNFVVM